MFGFMAVLALSKLICCVSPRKLGRGVRAQTVSVNCLVIFISTDKMVAVV